MPFLHCDKENRHCCVSAWLALVACCCHLLLPPRPAAFCQPLKPTPPDAALSYCHLSPAACRLLYRLAPQYEFAIPVETMADCLRGLLNTVYDGDLDGLNASSRYVQGCTMHCVLPRSPI